MAAYPNKPKKRSSSANRSASRANPDLNYNPADDYDRTFANSAAAQAAKGHTRSNDPVVNHTWVDTFEEHESRSTVRDATAKAAQRAQRSGTAYDNLFLEYVGQINSSSASQNRTDEKKGPRKRTDVPRSLGTNDNEGNFISGISGKTTRRIDPLPFVFFGALALLALFFVYITFINPATFEITVNGAAHTVERGFKLQTCITYRYANPTPGDYLAIDDSIIEKGGGQPFWASVNGEETSDGNRVLHKGDEVIIRDGENVVEDFVTTAVTVPYTTRTSTDYYGYAFHVFTQGKDGLNTYRTGKTSRISIVEETVPMIPQGVVSVNATPGENKVIALTFDDGPWWTYTEEILALLRQYNAVATFFQVGTQIEEITSMGYYANLLSDMVAAGHEVLTHGYTHAAGSGYGTDMSLMSQAEQINEIQKGYQAIESRIRQPLPQIFRAPGGNLRGALIKNISPYVDIEVGWTIETNDWNTDNRVEDIVSALLYAQSGDVVHMHDGGGNRSKTIQALKIALPIMIERGYTFITVSDMLQYVNFPETATYLLNN
ncbi:MAG: polysaccharide deacetylase family protein [Eggerthellaceae bacterium]|nr:polysaccharide deacetylase family protein [Eggerthellaceae bacterium]